MIKIHNIIQMIQACTLYVHVYDGNIFNYLNMILLGKKTIQIIFAFLLVKLFQTLILHNVLDTCTCMYIQITSTL